MVIQFNMSTPENNLERIQRELQWVTVKDTLLGPQKPSQKTIYKILVPIGVVVTTGVLGTGLYHLIKRNSKKQQLFMRYRVLAQGITVAIAAIGVLHVKLTS